MIEQFLESISPASPWLKPEELIELAGVADIEPIKASGRIKRWLRRQRIPFIVACNGWPQVSRTKVREALGETIGMPSVSTTMEPDFSKVL